MRILTNRTMKNNGDSFSVTLEATEVSLEQVDKTVDDLFARAQKAIERQINEKEIEFPPKETEVTIPRVASSYNGNGNGSGATQKQKAFLKKLHADKRKGVDIETISKFEASQVIKELMEVS